MSYSNLDGVPTQTAGSSGVVASDWNTYVRDNFDALKFGHVVVADATAKSALGAVGEGTMVYQADNQKLYVYNAGWVEIHDLDNAGGLSDVARAAGGDLSGTFPSPTIGVGKVVTDRLNDLAVTTGKINDLAVTTGKLADGAVTSAKIADGTIVLGDLASALQQYLIPTGAITPFVGSSAPAGWLFCDGGNGSGAGSGTLNASAGQPYADLWGVLNSAGFSGIGSQSAMTLPDLRGRVPVGKGTNGDVDVLGDNEGIAAVDVANRRPKHYHNISGTATSGGVDHTHGYYQQPGYTAASSAGSGIPRAADNNAASGGYPTNTGGASAYLHTHPLSGTAGPTSSSPIDGPAFITVNYIIKF